MLAELTEIRRHLHAHPEPSFQEEHTADLIERTCLGWGITNLHRPIRTCVCVHLGTGGQPTIALRADIDCIAQHEQNDVPWRSTVPGFMHACGHDVHTTILLGAARSLAQEQLPGTCILLFQPAEEAGSPSGAAVLVDQAGWIEKHSSDEIYAFHTLGGHDGCASRRQKQTETLMRRHALANGSANSEARPGATR
jgi:hippurate hydrolase